MIFNDLLNALVARLQWDAYFSESAFPITVIGDDAIDWTGAMETALAAQGVACLISLRRVAIGDRGLAIIGVQADFTELPLVNKALANRKSALYAAVKAMSVWGHRWTPDEDVWNEMEFLSLELTRIEKETGQLVWTLQFRITTYLETVFSILSSGGEVALVNEAGAPLITSPTEP